MDYTVPYELLGRLAQSGRALPLQGRSQRFKSSSAHWVFRVFKAKPRPKPRPPTLIKPINIAETDLRAGCE